MKIRIGNRNYGFKVIELMIAVMIIAILVAIVYPSHIQNVCKSKSGDGQQLLLNRSINQEFSRSSDTSYAAFDDLPALTVNENYSYDFAAASTATTYSLQTVAHGDQQYDVVRDGTECTNLTLDQNGLKSPAVCQE